MQQQTLAIGRCSPSCKYKISIVICIYIESKIPHNHSNAKHLPHTTFLFRAMRNWKHHHRHDTNLEYPEKKNDDSIERITKTWMLFPSRSLRRKLNSNSFLKLIISDCCFFTMISFIFSFFHSIVLLTWKKKKTECFPQATRLRVSTSFPPIQRCYASAVFITVSLCCHTEPTRWKWWREKRTHIWLRNFGEHVNFRFRLTKFHHIYIRKKF